MKSKLVTIEGPEINIDLSEIAMLEMYGQRDSGAGWVVAKITLKSGLTLDPKMSPEEYDKLVLGWNPPVI